MAEIRLNKLTRQFNIGLGTLVAFLNEKGANLEENPNAKVSDEFLPALEKKFGDDLKAKQEAAKVDIKMKEIIEKNTKKQQSDEEYEPEKETLIKNLSPFAETKSDKTEKPGDGVSAAEETGNTVEADSAEAAASASETEKPQVESEETAPHVEESPVAEIPQEETVPAMPEEKTPKQEEVEAPMPEKHEDSAARQEQVEEPAEKESADTYEEMTETVNTPEAKKTVVAEQENTTVEPQSEETSAVAEKPSHDEQTEEKAAVEVEEPAKEETKVEPAKPELVGPKVIGKIDLSQFSPRGGKNNKKRERIAKGSKKVDVSKVEVDDSKKNKSANGNNNSNNNNGGNNNNRGKGQGGERRDQQQNNNGGKGRKKDRDRFKPAMTEAEEEEMQKQIQKQVKETYARMNDSKKSNFGAKYRKEKRDQASQKLQEVLAQEAAEKKVLKVTEFVTVNDLATLMDNTPVNKVIEACLNLGLMVSINQRLDAEALVLVAEEFGYKIEFITAGLTEEINQENDAVDNEENLVTRPPVITVMGHVDHGKTSLLDYIRKANVIAGEAGGITQHIGAYNVVLANGRRITFLDTPGHEAFTAMRARGAQLTDLAIIIIAADDAVMPQTVEAINHAQAAGVPMVFAINKIDKPGATPDRIYQQLAQMNILTEAWGGKYQCQEISAKKGLNVDKLLEKVLLETDMMDLKANPKKLGVGAVIESSLDKGRGYLATVLVQEGTIRKGDMMISGCYYGRVKAMMNERGQNVTEAGPSTPVSILGLNGAPSAGEKFNIMTDEKEAKSIANKREQLIRIQGIKTQKHMTLEEIGRRIAIGNFKELNIIVKGDVDGSVEALSDSLIKLSTEEIHVNVIHKAVGAISESDIMLATASDAIIIGFQVRPSSDARAIAEKEGIEIRLYSIIYDAINEVKDGIEGMLEPEHREEVTATAFVKQTFRISKIGTIAGCLIKDGKMTKSAKVRLIRDGIVVYTGDLASLKRGKDDVKEVLAGMECGISINNFNDIKDGDVIEAFQIVDIKRTL